MKSTLCLLMALVCNVAWAQPAVSDAPENGQWAANTTWFQMETGNNYSYRADVLTSGGKLALSSQVDAKSDVALWCLVGNVDNGYHFYNRAKGTGVVLGMKNGLAEFVAPGTSGYITAFDFVQSEKTGNTYWCVKEHGSANNYLNRNGQGEQNVQFWNSPDAVKGDNGSAILFTEVDLSTLTGFYASESDITAAQELIKVAPGYPKTTSAQYHMLNALVNSVGKGVIATELTSAVTSYKTATDIILPEDGKAYTFTSVMSSAADATRYYMKYENGKKVSVSKTAGDASIFVCKELSTTNANEKKYAFITTDGSILTWVGNDESGAYKENNNIYGYSSNFATEFNGKSDWNEITVKKNGTAAEDLGYLRLVARRNSSGTSSIIANSGKRFDQASDGYWFNGTNSSAWILTEVEYTNTDAQVAALAEIEATITAIAHVDANASKLGEGIGCKSYLVSGEKVADAAAVKTAINNATTANAVNAIKESLSVNLPEEGVYTMAFKTKAGGLHYFTVDGATLSTSTDSNDASKFYCMKNGSGNFVYIFISEGGKYLKFHTTGKTAESSNTLIDEYNSTVNNFMVEAMIDKASNINSDVAARLGTVCITVDNRTAGDATDGCFILKNSNTPPTFDVSTAPFHKDDLTSAIVMTKVEDYTMPDAMSKAALHITKTKARAHVAANAGKLGEGIGYAHYIDGENKLYTADEANAAIDAATTAEAVNAIMNSLEFEIPTAGVPYYLYDAEHGVYLDICHLGAEENYLELNQMATLNVNPHSLYITANSADGSWKIHTAVDGGSYLCQYTGGRQTWNSWMSADAADFSWGVEPNGENIILKNTGSAGGYLGCGDHSNGKVLYANQTDEDKKLKLQLIEVNSVYTLRVLGEGVEDATITIKGVPYKNGNVIGKEEEIQVADITASEINGKVTVINVEDGNIYVSYIDETTQYYTIRGGNGAYVSVSSDYCDADGNFKLTNTSGIKDRRGFWTFVPEEGGGYKIYNYVTGWSKVLGMTGSGENARATMVAPDAVGYTTAFDGNIKFDGTDGRIKLKGSEHNYWNKRGDYLALWDHNDAAGNDTGSKFFLTEVDFKEFVDMVMPIIPEERVELDAAKIQGIAEFTPDNANTLWYRTSAQGSGVSDPWMEYALPLGNGELGCMVYGGVLKEEIQFNEKTLWSGPANVVGAADHNRTFVNFGSLFVENLDESINENGVTDYVRYLDIEEGVAGVKFTANDGTKHSRKYFSSAPDQVIAGQYTVEGEGTMHLRFKLEPELENNPKYVSNDAVVKYEDGGMASFTGFMESVNYAARVHVKVNDGARIVTTGNGIEVIDATEVTFYLKGATNFDGRMDVYNSYFTSETPAQVNDRVKEVVDEAAAKDFAAIEAAHRENFREITGRMTFSLGLNTPARDTKELVDYYYPNNGNATSTDNDHLFLEQLYFHYGRYLAISSNRQPIAAPNNLQGIWSHLGSSTPWWNSDIHTNINVQMNYWPTEITNLSDLHKPFVNFIIRGAQSEGWNKVGEIYNDGHGWSVLTETSLYNSMSTWGDNYLVANVWYTSHLWMHYRYTQDKDFLEKAFPAMWSAAEFWFHRLIPDKGYDSATQNSGYGGTPYSFEPDGTYVAPNEYSAEQNAHKSEDGTAHAQQMISYLFENISEAIKILGRENVDLTDEQIAALEDYLAKTDKGLHTEVYTANAALNSGWTNPRNGIAKGDIILREWKYSPYDVSSDPSHRHMSHLMALFPLDQITPESPYFEPAVNSLKLRGDVATGWSMGWKVNLWARAQDGDHAHIIIKNALKHSTSYGGNEHAGGIYYNLFDSHAPFQIDGNFGVCSGIAEMLMQSAHGYINILPALPAVWEATGTVTGMKAIGNFTVDFNWENGKAQQVTIESHKGAPLKVRCKRGAMDIAKAKITVNGVEVNATVENGIATIPCNEGETVVIDFTTIKTVAYTVSGGTGTFNNDNANSKWEHVWIFNKNEAQPAPLQFTTTQNNMDSEAAENNMLIAPGNSGATYTLKVPFPFLIKGYSFHCDGPDGGNQKIVIGTNEYPVKDGADIEVTGLSAQQAQFTLSGNNASVEVTDFKVYITTDPAFQYADSYENITQWYYIQMNPADATNGQKYVNYNVSGNGELSADRDKPAEGSTKAYAWAFVGNPFDGFKVYNRAAGGDVAVHSTGSGPLTMQTGGTAFMVDASSNAGDGYFCFKTPFNNYWNLQSDKVQHYSKDGGCTILLTPVEEDPNLETLRVAALATMAGKVNTLGNTVDYYAYNAGSKRLYTLDALRAALRDADTEAGINELLASYRINTPLNGEFFRIKNNAGTGYLSGDKNTSGRVWFVSGIGEERSSIFLYTGGKLLSYANGIYLASNDFVNYTTTLGAEVGATFGFSASSDDPTKQLISFNDGNRSFHSDGTDKESNAASKGQTGAPYRFTLESVTALPFTISAVGYGTLWAPVALKIPEHVKAYTGVLSDDETELVLTKITTGIIPAETGVVIYRDDEEYIGDVSTGTTHNFAITSPTETLESDFSGSVATFAKTGTLYTLQTHGDGVAFKQFSGTHITGFKAYLVFESEQPAQALRIRFAGENHGGTTSLESSELKAQGSALIYDLQGRRVLNPTKGMYIVNGKKVIVK